MLVLDVGSSTIAAGHVHIPRPVPRNSNSSRGQRPRGDWGFGLHGAPRSDSHFGFFGQRSIWVYSPSFSGVRFIRGAADSRSRRAAGTPRTQHLDAPRCTERARSRYLDRPIRLNPAGGDEWRSQWLRIKPRSRNRPAGIQDSCRRLVIPEAEQERIGIFEAQLAQGDLDAGLHQRGNSRIGLQRQHHAVAPRLHSDLRSACPRGRAGSCPSKGSLRRGRRPVPRPGRHSEARRHAEAAGLQTGTAKNPFLHKACSGISRRFRDSETRSASNARDQAHCAHPARYGIACEAPAPPNPARGIAAIR
jgi:hypothetical protein